MSARSQMNSCEWFRHTEIWLQNTACYQTGKPWASLSIQKKRPRRSESYWKSLLHAMAFLEVWKTLIKKIPSKHSKVETCPPNFHKITTSKVGSTLFLRKFTLITPWGKKGRSTNSHKFVSTHRMAVGFSKGYSWQNVTLATEKLQILKIKNYLKNALKSYWWVLSNFIIQKFSHL